MDGYGWEGASSSEPGLADVKARLAEKYFKYDAQQKLAIEQHEANGRYIDSRQNYMIPTDLFRYCSKDCTLSGVLDGLTWKENVIETNSSTGDKSVVKGTKIEGLQGRIPAKLFDSLTDTQVMESVFKDTNFDAYVGLQGTTFTRGIMYPPGMFKYCKALTTLKDVFMTTTIPVGVDINADMFESNTLLTVISGCWSNCKFDNRAYNAQGTAEVYPQFDFVNTFKNNNRISDASNLFAVLDVDGGDRGLLLISEELLGNCYNINSINNMFYYCTKMKGSVPLFPSPSYPVLNVVSGYLTGVKKANITNADQLESRLVPAEWL